MSASNETQSTHAENFSLKDFFPLSGATLTERVRPFAETSRFLSEQGLLLYSRELQGATGAEVEIRDPLTRTTKRMIMLGSNNYLGLANHPEVLQAVKAAVDRYGTGMGGPPLLNGMSRLHRELEERLAALKGAQDAMLFASGFQANIGWVGALMRDDDVLLYDELNHASLYDGIRLASTQAKIKSFRFRHNDLAHLEKLLNTVCTREPQAEPSQDSSGRMVFVAVEGVYSMDGDLAPLPEIRALCDRFGAVLFVDDAHGTAVMGPHGGGTAEHFGIKGRVELNMGTFSKAFGTTGGFLAGDRELIHYLRYFARSYMFSAHLPPTVVATVLAGLRVLEREPERRTHLHANVRYLCEGLRARGFNAHAQAGIIPILIPTHVDVREVNRVLHELGVFLNSVEYPAVARDAQRLRLSLMSNHTREQLDQVLAAFEAMSAQVGWSSPQR